MLTWIALAASFTACESTKTTPESAAAPTRELARADAVAAADLDGDGVDELVLIAGGVAKWPGGEVTLDAGVHAVARDDRDGDGREVLLIGVGVNRDYRETPARVWRIDASGATVLWERDGDRNQITDLRVTEDGIWLTAFADNSFVEGGWLVDGKQQPLVRSKFANRQLPLGPDQVLVGRIYGDKPKSDGDLRLVIKGSPAKTLPTLRGVRSLAAADLNSDGQRELLVGDGWHYAYGQQGVARVRLLEGPDWTTGRTIASFDGEYTVREILPFDGGLIAVGTKAVHLLQRDTLGWSDTILSETTEVGQAILIQDTSGPAVLLSGDPAKVIPLPSP